MKFKVTIILINVLILFQAFAGEDGRIQSFELNPKVAHTIYVYPKDQYPTTVMLPGPIEKVFSSKVITDEVAEGQERLAHPFIISHDLGSNFFTLKSVAEKIGTKAGINFVYDGQVYIVDLEVAEKGYRSVTYQLPRPLATSAARALPATPPILASQLDKAKRQLVSLSSIHYCTYTCDLSTT